MLIEKRVLYTDWGIVEIERVYDENDYLVSYLPLPLREIVRPVSIWEEEGFMLDTGFEDFDEEGEG